MPSQLPAVTVPEAVAALIVLSHGVMFLSPPATFALSINYRVMQSIAPEWAWGGEGVGVFALWLFAIIAHRLRMRQVLLTILGIGILWMGVSFFLSNVNTTIGYTMVIVGAGTLAAMVGLR